MRRAPPPTRVWRKRFARSTREWSRRCCGSCATSTWPRRSSRKPSSRRSSTGLPTGTPDRPGAWLLTTARRRALDRLRARRVGRTHAPARSPTRRRSARRDEIPDVTDPEAIADDRLRLLFTCCHPALPAGVAVALTLRMVAASRPRDRPRVPGDRADDGAAARAREEQDPRGRDPVPGPGRCGFPDPVDAVLAVLYLIFNEGYTSTSDDALVRDDLAEAVRVARLLDALLPSQPEAEGLLALMLLRCRLSAPRARRCGRRPLTARASGPPPLGRRGHP